MGSDSSKYKLYNNKSVGNLAILLNEEFYFPQEEVKGTICVESLQDIDVYGLDLKFFSAEKWKCEKDGKTQSKNNEETIQDLSINIMPSLKTKEESEEFYLPKGHHNFPFSFKLSDSIYPSFEFKGIDSQISLRYVIYASLKAIKGEKYSLSNLKYVIVRSPPKTLNTPLNISCLSNVRSWWFFDQGLTNLNVSYEKNNYKFADPIELKILIDNTRGNSNVEAVKIRMFQKITFKDQDLEVNCHENIIFENKVSANVDSGKKSEISHFVQFLYEKLNSEIYKLDMPYTHFEGNSLNVLKFQPSIETNLIKCEYSIKISLYFKSFVSYRYRPRLVVPLWISHKVDENIKKIENKEISQLEIKPQITSVAEKEGINPKVNENADKFQIIPQHARISHLSVNEINQSRFSLLNNESLNEKSYENYTNLNANLITNNKTQQNMMNIQKEQFEDINSVNYPLLGPPITGRENQK